MISETELAESSVAIPGDRAVSAPQPNAPRHDVRRFLARHLWWMFILLLAVVTVALHDYHGGQQNLNVALKSPSWHHLLGTDDLGRDVLEEVLTGLPWSVEVSTVATIVAGLLGLVIGVAAAWYDGIASRAALRLIDFYVAFPFIVFAVVLVGVVGRGTTQLGVILGTGVWPIVARIVYGETQRIREEEYVVYARVVWQRDLAVITRHVLPALSRRFSVVCAFIFGDVLGASAGLGLLGIGPPLGTPNWGSQLATGQQYLANAPWIAGGAALALVLFVVIVNLLADRVR